METPAQYWRAGSVYNAEGYGGGLPSVPEGPYTLPVAEVMKRKAPFVRTG